MAPVSHAASIARRVTKLTPKWVIAA